MITREVTVTNDVGLHARCATYFIQRASEFKASIWIQRDEKKVNAKSLLGVLSLGIMPGTTFNIIADGIDQEKAVNTLVSLVLSNFKENE